MIDIIGMRILIQVLTIGIMCGYKCYKEDNKLDVKKTPPKSEQYWMITGLFLPLVLIFCVVIDAIEGKNKKH